MLEVKVEQCAGIDVGKKFIDVCVLIGPANRKPAGGNRNGDMSDKGPLLQLSPSGFLGRRVPGQ